MNNTRHYYNEHLLNIIEDPELRLARQSVAIKHNVLFDYLTPAGESAALFEAFAQVFAEQAEESFGPDDPSVFRDADGDLALAQPYAETFVLPGAGHFGGALMLILMAETCYEPTLRNPARLIDALDRYHPMVTGDRFPSANLLHQFLEVDQPLGKWLAGHMARHQMVPFHDFNYVTQEDDGPDSLRKPEIADVFLSPEMAGKIATTTPTLRGRKMRGCLVEPGMRPFDPAEPGMGLFDPADNDPALLELLFTPPTRGLASL